MSSILKRAKLFIDKVGKGIMMFWLYHQGLERVWLGNLDRWRNCGMVVIFMVCGHRQHFNNKLM
jgi:hypothetical protein